MAFVVLVHGFWADGSSWNGVIPELVAAGHTPLAVQLPLTGFADDVAAVRRAAGRAQGPLVLAGHSYGGAVISEAATALPATALVFVAAYALDQGDDVMALSATYPAPGGAAIRPTDDGFLWLDVDAYPDAFCQDVDPAIAAVMARTQGPASVACLSGLTGPAAWHTVPSWYQVSAKDRTISPDAQRWMAERAGATVVEVDAGHAALVSRPRETAELILRAAAGQR